MMKKNNKYKWKKQIIIICILSTFVFVESIYSNIKLRVDEVINYINIDKENLIKIESKSITKNEEYLNTKVNMPIIIYEDKDIEQKINNTIKKDITSYYKKIKNQSEEYYSNFDELVTKFELDISYDLKKNSDEVLSIILTYYTYSGGAHGYTENRAYNFSLRDGKQIYLEDIFIDNSNYIEELNKKIRHIIKENKEYEKLYCFKGIKNTKNFYIQDNDLVIYFDLYEIAPYVAGIVEFKVNEKEINSILKKEYINLFK